MSINSLLENNLINYSFLFLFITMICYWVYFASSFKGIFFKFGQISNIFANLLIFISFILRWFISGHFPLSNHATRNSKNYLFKIISKKLSINFKNLFIFNA